MASSPLYGRLSIIIAVTILLFLSLTFSGNNISNNALAQSSYCSPEDPADYSPAWCIWGTRAENYPHCVAVWTEHNEQFGSLIAGMETSVIFVPEDVSERCELPPPPAPLQPLTCNELQTCPPAPCDPNFASCPSAVKPVEGCVPSLATPRCTQPERPEGLNLFEEERAWKFIDIAHSIFEIFEAIGQFPFIGPGPVFFPDSVLCPHPPCEPA